MGQRFVITEEEKNNISKMYGIVNEQQESKILWDSLKSSTPLSAEQQRELVIYLKGILKKTPSGCYNVPEGFAYNTIDTISHALNHEGSETCTFCRLPHSENSKWTHLRIRNACFNVGRNRVFDDPTNVKTDVVTTVDMEDSPIFPPTNDKTVNEQDVKKLDIRTKVLDPNYNPKDSLQWAPNSKNHDPKILKYYQNLLKKAPNGCYYVPHDWTLRDRETIVHEYGHEGWEKCKHCDYTWKERGRFKTVIVRNACWLTSDAKDGVVAGANIPDVEKSVQPDHQSLPSEQSFEDSVIIPPKDYKFKNLDIDNIKEQVQSNDEIDPKIAACAMKVLDLKDYTKIPTCLKLAAKVMLFKKMPEFKDMQDGLKCAGELASIDQAPEKALEFFKCVYENITDDMGNPMDMVKHLSEDFTGIKNGNIQYTTKGGKNLEYKVTHPMSDFEVIEFNMKDGKFKLKGNFLAGEQVGVIHPNILSQIETNMEQAKPSFDVVTKKEGQKVTFKLV